MKLDWRARESLERGILCETKPWEGIVSCCICAWDDEYGASGASDGKESDSKFCWNSFEVGAEKLRSDGRRSCYT